jgi:hypothetical protein
MISDLKPNRIPEPVAAASRGSCSPLGIMTRVLLTGLLVAMLCACSAILAGCVSKGVSTSLAYEVGERVLGQPMDIMMWTEAFRTRKGRLPQDYVELCRFVSRETGSRVQLQPYDRVDFAVLPSGQRQAVCYTVSDGITNHVSGRSKGTGSGRKWSLLDDSRFPTLRR